MAQNYDCKSARNAKNKATVEKIKLSKDLCYNRTKNYKLNLF